MKTLNPETIGTLNLKIVRLERYLKLLKEQQYLSQPYPDYQARIILESHNVQAQLNQLKQQREEIAKTAIERPAENGYTKGTVYSISESSANGLGN